MGTAGGCTQTEYALKGGGAVARVRYGDESEDWSPEKGQLCHDCGVAAGELHHPGCDVEVCRLCGGQLIGCECPYADA